MRHSTTLLIGLSRQDSSQRNYLYAVFKTGKKSQGHVPKATKRKKKTQEKSARLKRLENLTDHFKMFGRKEGGFTNVERGMFEAKSWTKRYEILM